MAAITETPSRGRATTRPSGTFKLRGRTYRIALFAHILGSVGWFGLALGVLAAFVGSQLASPVQSTALLHTIEASPWLTIPVGLVAAATGLLLSLGTKWGVVRYWWVVVKIAISIVVVVTDAFVVGAAAHDHLASASNPGDLYGPTIAHAVVLALATLLSVLKPGGRTPWTRSRTAVPSRATN